MKNGKLSDALRSISAALYEMAKVIDAEEDAKDASEQVDYYIDSEEAAERMKCCRQSVYNRFKHNLIKGNYLGGRLMVSALSVDMFNKHFNKKFR